MVSSNHTLLTTTCTCRCYLCFTLCAIISLSYARIREGLGIPGVTCSNWHVSSE